METITNINASNITFSDVKKNARNGGKSINILLNGKAIVVRVPSLRAPFGISAPNDQVKEYYLSLSLTPEVEEKFTEIDDHIASYVAENSVELLGKKVAVDVIKDLLLNPIVKKARDAKYSNTIKMKASSGEGRNPSDFYVSKTDKVSINEIRPGSSIETIIEISQIWFINGKFGASVKLLQGKVAPSTRLTEYAFGDDDDEEDVPNAFV